ncbi:MAG: hypothetical protein NTZ65_05025 [Candidatus Berkelbacteria bacterium]|nr:hypothetical protein [Candidatus Berkelbacteria bacterium]
MNSEESQKLTGDTQYAEGSDNLAYRLAELFLEQIKIEQKANEDEHQRRISTNPE